MNSINILKIYAKQQNLLLKFTVFYYVFTVLLSILGPVKYFDNAYKYWLVLPFVTGVCFCLYIGYYLGKYTKPKTIFFRCEHCINRSEYHLIKTTLTVSVFSLVLELAYLISINHFSLNLFHFGELYNTRITDNVNLIILIRFLCSPFRMISTALGIYKFHQLPRIIKRILILNVVLNILVFLFGYGNQKGVANIVIYLIVAIYINRIRKNGKLSKNTVKLIGTVLTGAFLLFSYVQYLRFEPLGINAANFHHFSTGEFYFDTDYFIFKLFGEKIGFGMACILSSYLSQGYYGLSLCMQLPFVWSFGLGSSFVVSRVLDKFVGIGGIFERTYLNRMTETFGRNGLASWNTIFPWLASDYTWLGAMLFFILVGYFMSKAWKEVILNNNIVSYLVLINVLILVLFTPANNQLFHGYDSFFSTWFIIIFWIFFRGKYMHECKNSKD